MTPVRSTQAESPGDLRVDWRYRAVIWSVAIAAAGYCGFALWIGWRDVADAVGRVGAIGIVAALSLSLVNYSLRFCRWQAYFRAMDHPMPWLPSLKIYLAGFALTTTPAKAGEVLRGVLLRRWAIPYSKSFAAFLSERLSDLLAIVLLTLVGLAVYPAAQPLIGVGAAGVLAAFLVITNQSWLQWLHDLFLGSSRIAVLARQLFEVLMQARLCHLPMLLAQATGLSLVAWASEAWALYLILHWMGLDVALPVAVFVYAISMLAGALTFLPGGLGGAEAVMVSLLAWVGIGTADAIAATILIRITTLWFAVAIGCLSLAWQTRAHGHPALTNDQQLPP